MAKNRKKEKWSWSNTEIIKFSHKIAKAIYYYHELPFFSPGFPFMMVPSDVRLLLFKMGRAACVEYLAFIEKHKRSKENAVKEEK